MPASVDRAPGESSETSIIGREPVAGSDGRLESSPGIDPESLFSSALAEGLEGGGILEPLRATGTNPFSCDPGVYYSIGNESGDVYELRGGGALSATAPELKLSMNNATGSRAPDAPDARGGFNGLAIGAHGQTAYSFKKTSYNNQSNSFLEIYRWNVQQNATEAVWFQKSDLDSQLANYYLIAGGMPPSGEDKFYFGGYTRSYVGWTQQKNELGELLYRDEWGNAITSSAYPAHCRTEGTWKCYQRPQPGYWAGGIYIRPTREYAHVATNILGHQYRADFHLFAYDHASGQVNKVGVTNVDTYWRANQTDTNVLNGDLAFDAQGNLILLYHNGTDNRGRIATIRNTDLSRAEADANPQYRFTAQLAGIREYGSSQMYNGLAVNRDGSIVVGYNHGDWNTPHTYRSGVSQISPAEGNTIARWYPINEAGTQGFPKVTMDLASCNVPPMLEVAKNFSARADSTDQVDLIVSDREPVQDETFDYFYGWQTTEGTAPGIQDKYLGPLVVQTGSDYYITERFKREVTQIREIVDEDGNVIDTKTLTQLQPSPVAAGDYSASLSCTLYPEKGVEGQTLAASLHHTGDTFRTYKITVPAELRPNDYPEPAIRCQFTNTPVRMEVTKNFTGRADESDQVKLVLSESATLTDPLAEVVTEGTQTGVQEQKIAPTGVKAGGTYYIAEQLLRGGNASKDAYNQYDKALVCTVTKADGTATNLNTQADTTNAETGLITYRVTLPQDLDSGTYQDPAVSCQFINSPLPNLTLVKVVDNDFLTVPLTPADPGEFTLQAKKESSVSDFATGANGVTLNAQPTDAYAQPGATEPMANAKAITATHIPVGTYILSEVIPKELGTSVQNPALSWSCKDNNATASHQLGFALEGDNAKVTVEPGMDVVCTVHNTSAAITVLKDFPSGDASQIKLSAIAEGDSGNEVLSNLPKLWDVSGSNTPSADNTIYVRPGTKYTLSEKSDVAYLYNNLEVYIGNGTTADEVAGAWESAKAWQPVTDDAGKPTLTVSAEADEHKIYRFVNKQPSVPGMPLTGGMSRDAFLIGAAALVTLGATAITTTWWRRRRTTNA